MAEIKNKQLQEAVTALGKRVTQDAEAIRAAAHAISTEAQDTARIADQLSGLGVDPATIGETRELSTVMGSIADASTTYASAAADTARTAFAAVEQARTSHDGIHEAVNRSPVDVTDLNRSWVTPE